MSKILIKNGRIWDGERFYFSDILTDGEKIKKISEQIADTADFVFNADGKIVSPGFVDAHVHMRGINKEFGINSEMSSIPFGVTAVADACAICGDKNLLDSFLVKNVVFVPVEIRENKAFFDSAENGLKKYGEKTVGIKIYFDTQVSEAKDLEPLCETIEYAAKHGLIVMVHSSNSPVSMSELLGVLRKGDILTHAYHGGINNIGEDDFESLKAAKECGVIIDAGFAGHVHTDFKIFRNAILNDAMPNIISTDITKFSAYKRGGRYGMTMCMSMARELGMNEEDIFRAVTSAPAKALGKKHEWGFLKTGRCADITVLDYTDEGFDLTDKAGNRIASKNGYKCVLTVADSEVVYRD